MYVTPSSAVVYGSNISLLAHARTTWNTFRTAITKTYRPNWRPTCFPSSRRYRAYTPSTAGKCRAHAAVVVRVCTKLYNCVFWITAVTRPGVGGIGRRGLRTWIALESNAYDSGADLWWGPNVQYIYSGFSSYSIVNNPWHCKRMFSHYKAFNYPPGFRPTQTANFSLPWKNAREIPNVLWSASLTMWVRSWIYVYCSPLVIYTRNAIGGW